VARKRSKKNARNNRSRSVKDLGKPSVWQAIRGANERAKSRVNKRVMRRNGQRSIKAAIADVQEDVIELSIPKRMWRWMLAMGLIPLCIITTLALLTVGGSQTSAQQYWYELLKTKEFLYFGLGMVLTAGWFYTRLLEDVFLYMYVLGHELTHAVFVVGCFGKVSGIQVRKEGGYVITNKTNILIALSPYFVPFWSVVFFAICALIGLFWEIPYREEVMYFLLGGGWIFHLLWTVWMIPQDQPDLQENGTFFSLMFILLANILVLACLFCLTMGDGAFKSFGLQWWYLFQQMIEIVTQQFFK